jgi:hypothetical protein
MNRGNRPNFFISNRQKVIGISIATIHASNYINNLPVTQEVSCSDHRYIRFTLTGIYHLVAVYRNVQWTDWQCFRTGGVGCVRNMTDRITNCIDIETAENQFQNDIINVYNENCSLTVTRNKWNISWWNEDRAERIKYV